MNNILSKRKSACLSVVGDCPFHFRAEMNENVGGNWKKRRHVFFKFVQKIPPIFCTKHFRICTNFPEDLQSFCPEGEETFSA